MRFKKEYKRHILVLFKTTYFILNIFKARREM